MSFLGFLRRLGLWSIALIALLCLLWIGLCWEERWRGERAWNDYRAAAVARGVDLELADLRRTPVPDEENFAAAPMIRDLFAEVPRGASDAKWFQALNMRGYHQPSAERGRKAKDPDLVSWRDHFVNQRVIEAASNNPADDVLRALDAVRPELDALHEAGERPKSRFPTQWERGMATTLPHLGPLHRAELVQELAMAAYLGLGDSAEAYVSAREVLRLYEALREELTVFAGEWRLRTLDRLNAVIRDGLLADRWAEPELQKLSVDLARIDWQSDWRFAVSSERVYVNTNFDLLEQTPDSDLSRFTFAFCPAPWYGTPAVDTVIARAVIAIYPRGWLSLSRLEFNEYFDRQIAWANAMESGLTPALEHKRGDAATALDKNGSRLHRIMYFTNLLYTTSLPSIRDSYLKTATQIAITRTACQLALYQHRNGSFPDSLNELVPEFLPEIPRDLMDGAPLRYRRTETGYDLWSIGSDLKDDGGIILAPKDSRPQPDWVFHLVRADENL